VKGRIEKPCPKKRFGRSIDDGLEKKKLDREKEGLSPGGRRAQECRTYNDENPPHPKSAKGGSQWLVPGDKEGLQKTRGRQRVNGGSKVCKARSPKKKYFPLGEKKKQEGSFVENCRAMLGSAEKTLWGVPVKKKENESHRGKKSHCAKNLFKEEGARRPLKEPLRKKRAGEKRKRKKPAWTKIATGW